MFSEYTLKLSCAMRFKFENLRSYKIEKIPNLTDVHDLYQLLHSQVYPNGLKKTTNF